MTNLERLKLQLNNKEYYTDTEYTLFLDENGLTATDTYDKSTMQIKLLETVVSVLETLSNDIDLMRKIDTTELGLSTEEAYKYLEKRIKSLNEKILELKEEEETEEYSNVRLLFFTNIITQ